MPAPGDDAQETGRLTMRSLLFVPGDSERKMAKALGSGADVIIVDLEDSVAPANKEAARLVATDFINDPVRRPKRRIYVRINDLRSGLARDDLAATLAARPDGIMLPKCNSGADVTELAAMLRVAEAEHGIDDGATRIIALITETAAGTLAAGSYGDPHPRLSGLSWGAEDLSAAIGASTARDADGRYTDVFRFARAITILASSAASVAAIDTVYVDFRDPSGLTRECLEAAREARAIVKAFADAGNPGVVGLDGKMYDRPHLRRAERLLARATAAGVG
jgi:citrate lyase subunit beta/citryl-CoA lyase